MAIANNNRIWNHTGADIELYLWGVHVPSGWYADNVSGRLYAIKRNGQWFYNPCTGTLVPGTPYAAIFIGVAIVLVPWAAKLEGDVKPIVLEKVPEGIATSIDGMLKNLSEETPKPAITVRKD